MEKIVDECYGCERCVQCGRNHMRTFVCDKCEIELDDVYYSTPDGDFCEDCFFANSEEYANTLTLQNALKVADETSVYIPHFLYWLYSANEIEAILLRDFRELPKEEQRDILKEYAETDRDAWIDELADKDEENALMIKEYYRSEV
ncbi:MAG: hypothetical protein J5662_05720 [Clostridia bacterium]|nr:hypothetical protein [Clostridia bacterium]